MAVTVRAPRRPRVHGLLIALTALAGVLAVMPIVAAVVGPASSGSVTRSAFANAADGMYVVGVRSEEQVDVVLVVPSSGGDPIEVARVPHLPNFGSTGAVSPSGRFLALVTPDQGTATAPLGTLHVLDIETGVVRTLAKGLDVRQVPAWDRAETSVVVRRTRLFADGAATVTFDRVGLDGYSRELGRATGVAGAFAVGFDPADRFVAVVLDGRGSTLVRDMAEVMTLSTYITRDWRLSPDGTELAFIETNLEGGLKYLPRLARLDGDEKGAALAQANGDSQALGVAWRPDGTLEFGLETAAVAGVSAQSAVSGFDVPLAFAPDGSVLAVQHWSGDSFENAGTMSFEITGPGGRVTVQGITRFIGWTAR